VMVVMRVPIWMVLPIHMTTCRVLQLLHSCPDPGPRDPRPKVSPCDNLPQFSFLNRSVLSGQGLGHLNGRPTPKKLITGARRAPAEAVTGPSTS
jgi:hypothetical protein